MTDKLIKQKNLRSLSEYRKKLLKAPVLRHLFFELTMNCNEHCKHCGSSCGDGNAPDILSTEEYFGIIDQIKRDFGTKGLMLCITGGEPLLRRDFFDIMGYANELGFNWGMTSNGTLIDRETAHRLRLAGMKTVSISIDGLEATHNEFRRTKDGYSRAMAGIQNLIDEGGFHHIQVTTVVTHESINELDALFDIFDKIDIDSWRVINLEPIGRAKQYPELLLTADDHKRLFSFIKEKRDAGYPLCYGCSHYLGLSLEAELRDWYFICNAGIYTASIMANGDIGACLDIERRPELIQGNIRERTFKDVWENEFRPFRDPDYRSCDMCDKCDDKIFCNCDSFHSWNFDDHRPEICMKEILDF